MNNWKSGCFRPLRNRKHPDFPETQKTVFRHALFFAGDILISRGDIFQPLSQSGEGREVELRQKTGSKQGDYPAE
jgi:hypothetical protein